MLLVATALCRRAERKPSKRLDAAKRLQQTAPVVLLVRSYNYFASSVPLFEITNRVSQVA
jgi:hypothetical protein